MFSNFYGYTYPYNPNMFSYTLIPQQSMCFSQYINPQIVTDLRLSELKDYGPNPFVINIEKATERNKTFRTALWTGSHLQLTLMSINPGEDIGLEVHPNTDQFLRIEDGEGIMLMGDSQYNLNIKEKVSDDFAIFIPAGKWHNLINTGPKPIKLYSIYAPPQHPRGTIHQTKQMALSEKH